MPYNKATWDQNSPEKDIVWDLEKVIIGDICAVYIFLLLYIFRG